MIRFAEKGVVLALSLMLFPSFLGCGKTGSTLVKVGNQSITEGDLDTLTRVNPRLKPRLTTPDGRQKILENYVEQELLYQESKKRGLDHSSQVKDKIELYNKILVAQALLDNELDRKVKEYYDNHRDEFERIKISDIFIRTAVADKKPEAKEAKNSKAKDKKKAPASKGRTEADALRLAAQVKERLNKGEDFGKLAKEISEDDKTRNTQGDLGYVTVRDKRLERMGWLPLAEKAFSMKVGEVSDVINTKDGFHVVKVTEDKKMQPFEEAEAGIRFRLQADIRTQLLDELKKKYKVEYAKETTKKDQLVLPESAPAQPPPVEPAPSETPTGTQ